MNISVITPVLDEQSQVSAYLDSIRPLRGDGVEFIVVDGGSRDRTRELLKDQVDRVLDCSRGRALQMNLGAGAATGEYLLFLHVDTGLPEDICEVFAEVLRERPAWGRFDVRLSRRCISHRVIGRMMNWRSRLSGIATGDQAIFVCRALFLQCGGYAEIELMEDIELCRRLRTIAGSPLCLYQQVVTSSRRWDSAGTLRTILLMWRLRLLYWFGVPAARLARIYYPDRRPPRRQGGNSVV